MTSILEQIMECLKSTDEEIKALRISFPRVHRLAIAHSEGISDGLEFSIGIVQTALDAVKETVDVEVR